MNFDKNLLFGFLALQNDFISREELIAAVSVWLQDKSVSLHEILVERGWLQSNQHQALEALLEVHLGNHANDVSQSLAAANADTAVLQRLQQLQDADVEATLVRLSATAGTAKFQSDPTLNWESRAAGPRFRLLRPHAIGGLGEVFVAEDAELHREVALKEIQSRHADDPDSRTRFVLEAEITGGLEHPGIVPVYGLGHYEDGRPYYAMRFIRGDSLKEAIDRFHKADDGVTSGQSGERGVEFRKLLGRFVDVCNAIQYAHSRGVLHRDLKPGNIMLGKYGETLVVDWGLAKVHGRDEKAAVDGEITLRPTSSGSSPTQLGEAMGTPAYMPPEQAAGRLDDLGPASDVFSLGATLYQLLTGQLPQTDKDLGTVLKKVQAGDFPPPRQVKRDIPKPLEAICLKAMALRPGDRYESPQALAEDIEQWLGDEPTSAYHEPLTIRARRWVRRHPALVSSSIVTVILASIAVGIMVTAKQRAHREALESAVADQRIARVEIQSGRFSSAETILNNAIERMQSQTSLAGMRKQFEAERDRIRRWIAFYKLTDQAWYLAGDANREIEALAKCRAALEEVDAWADGNQWWKRTPIEGLSDQQQQELKDETYRIWLLYASLLTKNALLDMLGSKGQQDATEALTYLDRAKQYRSSNFIQLVENVCYLRTGQPDKIKSLEGIEPETPDEYFFFGFIYMYLAASPTDEISTFVTSMVKQRFGLEFTDPLGKSEHYFKRAADLKPDRYWHHFMVAMSAMATGDFHGGDVALNACVALRPDLPWTYLLRGFGLSTLGNVVGDEAVLDRAEQAFQRAEEIDPHIPSLYSQRASVRAMALRWEEAFDDWLRYLELERGSLEAKTSLKKLKDEFRERVDADATNVDAHVALAHVLLKLDEPREAATHVNLALDLDAENHRALALRGTLRLEDDQHAAALQDFEQVLAVQPKNYLAAVGKAESLELAGENQAALEQFSAAAEVAVTDWQRAESQAGRSRVLALLGREGESAEALDEATRLDPTIGDRGR